MKGPGKGGGGGGGWNGDVFWLAVMTYYRISHSLVSLGGRRNNHPSLNTYHLATSTIRVTHSVIHQWPSPHKSTIRGLPTPIPIRTHKPLLSQPTPHLKNTCPPRRQHAILQAIEAFAVDGRDEAAGGEAEEDAGGEVVFADAVAELEVLVEHGAKGEGDRLWVLCG